MPNKGSSKSQSISRSTQPSTSFSSGKYRNFDIDIEPIQKLKRCAKCVLPETMPFISFDKDGVCNYCRSYKPTKILGEDKLRAFAENIKRTDGNYDSVVCFSGGRDSSYGLHYFKKELGLNPIAYTYDWGMVTDVAKRNQARMLEQLDVKMITVSANINKKRDNIRKNILAWLKKPDIGLVPLFMAGDKQFYYYANQVGKNYHLKDVLLAVNPYEKTLFKAGFVGVDPNKQLDSLQKIERLSAVNTLKQTGYYIKAFARNPAYINSSMLDTAVAAASYYVIPHNYFRLFEYIQWNEDKVDSVLIDQYGWELAPDTKTTWRIGDGTAPFYNYIYYLVCGFSENDTLRSNQVREGMLDREEALKLVERDNHPRFETMQWYFDVVKLDMVEVLKAVQKIPRLYDSK